MWMKRTARYGASTPTTRAVEKYVETVRSSVRTAAVEAATPCNPTWRQNTPLA